MTDIDALKDSFVGLERHRQRLEENVEKLSQALNHWRQWKEDYETLRQDVKTLPSSATRSDLMQTREDFEGELLDEKELAEIFGKNDSKNPEQIISVLSNRLDYVAKNIDTLQKQLEAAENKLAAVTVISNPDVGTDEDGLPITEIMEELDDDDNVVSYSLRRPGDNQAQLIEALKKAGVADIPVDNAQKSLPEGGETASTSENAPTTETDPSKTAPSEAPAESKIKPKSAGKKKSVAFTEDTKVEDPQVPSETAQKVERIMKSAKEQEAMISEPVLPVDESAEDASLREDMLRYNKETMLYEMAPIVAELNLEEASDIDTDEYSDYEDDDDDEDQWGRSTGTVVDDDWKLQMLELKERLSNHTFGTEVPVDSDTPHVEDDQKAAGVGRISIKEEVSGASVSKPSNLRDPSEASDEKKSVRFAQSLDISEGAPTNSKQVSAKQPAPPAADPMSEIVMERSTGAGQGPNLSTKASTAPRKASRFKQSRGNGPSSGPTFGGMPIASYNQSDDNEPKYAPTGPDGQVLADSVLEHKPSQKAKEPDEFDDSLLQQQVAEEYHKARNKFIHRQGGFMKEDENPIQPLSEEEGGPKKMSRFKAARLAKS